MTDQIELVPGIFKKIIEVGEGGELPQAHEVVEVHYEGRLEDGTVFDSSYPRGEPLETAIGVGQVIHGWDVGIMSMTLGEKAELTISGEHAYGASGSPPVIGPNATLIFKVELLSIGLRKAKTISDEKLITLAQTKKVEAAEKFKAGDLKAAETMW